MAAQSVGQKLSEWWQSWTGFNPTYSDLSCCAQEEVDRIAHDIGVSPAELRELARLGPHAADQLVQRMQALHLDPTAVEHAEPPTFQDLQRICSLCEHHKRCQQDIASDAAAPAWESYCPNAATLKVLTTIPWPKKRGQ